MSESSPSRWLGVHAWSREPPSGELQLWSGCAWRGIRLAQRLGPSSEMVDVAPREHMIWLVLRGTAAVEGGWSAERPRRWTAVPGTVTVLPAGAPLTLRWQGECEYLEIELSPELAAAELRREGREGLFLRPRVLSEEPAIRRIALGLREEIAAGMPGGRLYGESLALALISRMWAVPGAEEARIARGGLPPGRLRRLLAHVEERLDGELTVDALAQVVSLSPAHFARMFKESTGLAPHQYVLRKRIERASRLLRDTERPIADIALRSGFSAQSSFTTAFRAVTGLTPRAYRQRIAN